LRGHGEAAAIRAGLSNAELNVRMNCRLACNAPERLGNTHLINIASAVAVAAIRVTVTQRSGDDGERQIDRRLKQRRHEAVDLPSV
jgi:hypothetical protein